MKTFILIPILLNFGFSVGQNITVEKVKLIETLHNKTVSEIPKVKDLADPNNKIVDKINASILKRFNLNSFEQSKIKDFRWFDVKFISDIKNEILYIRIEGEYHGNEQKHVLQGTFYDLTTGDALFKRYIPFPALFTLEGYLDMLNKYWLPGAKEAFKEAIECANSEPYCSYYDIDKYKVENQQLVFSITDDCYTRYSQACSPYLEISIPLDSIRPYLNGAGKRFLFESGYYSKSSIDKFIINEELHEEVPDNTFFFGKINNKYPFSMAINMRNRVISGYYYYDNKKQKIKLSGSFFAGKYLIVEEVNGAVTGTFEFELGFNYHPKGFFIYKSGQESEYMVGKWTNHDQSKIYDITFTEIKFSD